MPGPLLHVGATVLCAHGGTATPTAPAPRTPRPTRPGSGWRRTGPAPGARVDNRVQEISQISQGLKALATGAQVASANTAQPAVKKTQRERAPAAFRYASHADAMAFAAVC